jgi:hypothetical protein
MNEHVRRITEQIAHVCELYLGDREANLGRLLNAVSGLSSALDSSQPAALAAQIEVFLGELDEIEYFCPPDSIREKAQAETRKLLAVIATVRAIS